MTFHLEDGRTCLYQWDINRRLVVTDSTITELHFCNKTDDCSLVVPVYDGLANIPNLLLQSDFPIKVYGFASDHTRIEETFKVKARTKPSDYIYTETEVLQYSTIAARMDKLEKEFDEDIGDAVTAYLEENPLEVDLSNYYTKSQTDTKVNAKANKSHTHTLSNITDYKAPTYTINEVDFATVTEVEPTGYNTLRSNKISIIKSTVLNVGKVDFSKYARIEIAYGSSINASFTDKFIAVVSDATLPTAITDNNVLAYDMIENPTQNWTHDRTAVLELPADINIDTLYLAVTVWHGITIYSIKLIEAPNLTPYALKTDIQGLATEEYVTTAIQAAFADIAQAEEGSY